MADGLTASFRLVAEDGVSGPLGRIEGLFKRLDDVIAQLGRQPGMDGVERAVNRAAGSVEKLNSTLERTQGAARGAATAGASVGAAVADGAGQGIAALDRMQTKLRAISAEDLRRAVNNANAPMSDADRDRPSPRPGFSARGYAGDVVGGVRHVGEATEHGVGRAFGAAAAGFGLIEPVKKAAEFDNTLRHIAITLGLSGAAGDRFVAQFGRQMDQLARATGQTGEKLAEAAGFFSREGYSLDKIKAVLPTVAKISTAYNADPEAVAKTSFALQENLGIGDKQLPMALSKLALAGKQADLPLEKLAPLFPEVAAQAGALGVKGEAGVTDLAAMLAVVRKSVGTEGEAATDTRSFMQAITSQHTAARFAKHGVDLFGVLNNARAQGKDPLEAVLAKVDAITKHGTDLKVLGELFNNQQDRAFVNAILQHMKQYQEIKEKVQQATPKMLEDDFTEGMKSLRIQTQAFGEALEQLERRVGTRFAPIMALLTRGLQGVISGFDWLDQHVPGATTVIIGAVGGLLALAAVLGAIGAVWGPLAAGFGLLMKVLSPLRLLLPLFAGISLGTLAIGAAILAVAAVITAAVVDIYDHWARFAAFFRQMGAGLLNIFSGLVVAIYDLVTGRWSKIPAALMHSWSGLKLFFGGLWGVVKTLFSDFGTWVESWGGNIPKRILAALQGAWTFLVDGYHTLIDKLRQPFTDFENTIAHSWAGRQLGLGGATPTASPAAVPVSAAPAPQAVTVHVTHDPGLQVKQTAGPRDGVRITPDRGRMVNRP